MATEQQNGKLWIDATLRELATRRALTIESVEWHQSADDLRSGAESLILDVAGQRIVERFRLADLEDIPGDLGVRSGMEDYLAQLVGRIANR